MSNILTLKVRIRDRHASLLRAMSREVNTVWNYCNDLSERMIRERNHWPTGFDLHPYLKGSTYCFDHIQSNTIQEIAETHAKSRRQALKTRLRWRRSFRGDAKHSLGWVPFKSRAVVWRNGQIKFAGHFFKVWDSFGLSSYVFRAGAFVEDSRGRWYFTVAVNIEKSEGNPDGKPVGIDPGLADVATTVMDESVHPDDTGRKKDVWARRNAMHGARDTLVPAAASKPSTRRSRIAGSTTHIPSHVVL